MSDTQTRNVPAEPAGSDPPTTGEIVVTVSDPGLAGEVQGIAGSAGVPIGRAVGPATRLVISDRVRRTDSVPWILVTGHSSPDVWREAAAAGAEQVVLLPGGAELLVRRLRQRAPVTSGTLVRVVGARGGAGATTVAAGLARAAAIGRQRVVLVDGDAHGAGMDVALGMEQEPGLRWDDVADVRGPVPPRSLMGRLPVIEGVPVLSHRRRESAAQHAWAAITESLLTGADWVVADVPRYWLDRLPVATATVDILVVPHDVAAVAAARSLVDRGAVRADAVVALRRIRGPLAPSAVAEALPGHPLIEVPQSSAIAAAADFGDLGPATGRGPFAAACRSLLSAVGAGPGGA